MATITILGTKIGTGKVEDTLLSILTVVFLSVSISGKILFIYFYNLDKYFTMSLIFITAMTGDKMSDRTIVSIHVVLVKIYFPMITPTTSVGLIHTM